MKKSHISFVLFLILLFLQSVYAQKINDIPINTIKSSQNAQIESGNEMFLNGDYFGALNSYKEGIKRNEFVAYFNMGVTNYIIGQYKKAEECFKRALSINRESLDAELNLAFTYIMLGKLSQAEEILIKYVDKVNTPIYYVNLANLYLEMGSTAKAYFYINKALSLDPNNFYIQLALANYFASIGDRAGCLQIIKQLNPEGYFENFNVGRIYYNIEDYLSSNEYLKKALIYSESVEALELMAENYALLGEKPMQVDTLKKIVNIDDSKYNRINYAVGLYCIGAEEKSMNYVKELIKSNDDQVIFKYLYYDFLIGQKNIGEARTYVNNLYESSKSSANLYLYIKDLLFLGNRNDIIKARQLIYSHAKDSYINLAHILLDIKDRKYLEGLTRIKNIAYNQLDDFQKDEYNVLEALLLLNINKVEKAVLAAENIPYYRGEYFWFNFIGNWNLNAFSKMHKVIKKGQLSCLNAKKVKKVKLEVIPSLNDMHLSFTFYDRPIDIIDNMLYPIFMNANEILQILRFGSKLTENYNTDTALSTLSRSLAFTEAIDKNNKAVFDIIKYQYHDALDNLLEANNTLGNNPIILFNIGLAYKYIGDIDEALNYFEKSISSNKYFYPASIAKAALFAKFGRLKEAKSILENVYYDFGNHANDIKQLPTYIKNIEYLAGIGLGDFDNIEAKLDKGDGTQYSKLMKAVINYLNGEKTDALREMKNIKVFRSDYLYDFLTLYNGSNKLIMSHPNDVYYKFTIYFIKTFLGQKPYITFNRKDKYEVKEAIFYNIFFKQYGEALNNIKLLSDLDSQLMPLYEVALYYFMVIDDPVNAEGAYNSLMRYNSKNLFYRYYTLLYLLYKMEIKNIEDEINSLKNDYPSLINGYVLHTIYAFLKGDLRGIKDTFDYITDNFNNYSSQINIKLLIKEL